MTNLVTEIIQGNRIATLRKSMKEWRCAVCELPVMIQEKHYEVVYAGSGVKGKIDADHTHVECVWSKLNNNGNPYPPMIMDEAGGVEGENVLHRGWNEGRANIRWH